MKSKWLVLFIVFGLILTACGGGSDDAAEEEVVAEEPAEELDSPATTAAAAEPVADPPSICLVLDIGGLGDLSFNDLAYSGYQKAIEDFGMVGTFLEPDGGGENRGELLELCAEAGNDLIVGNGFLFDGAMNEVAPIIQILTLQSLMVLQSQVTLEECYSSMLKDLTLQVLQQH